MAGYEFIGKEELSEIEDVFNNGGVLFRNGFDQLRNNTFKVNDFEKNFAERMGTTNALAVSSGTAALRVALAALQIEKNAEVLVPSFTFVATYEAIIESGCVPVVVNVDNTLNIDPTELEASITDQTKAVIVVHMLGVPARLREIAEICKRRKIYMIEDTAWGCGGSHSGKPLGTWGDVGTFSFDFAKTITTGEGGMVVCKDDTVAERAAAWHDHGHENNPKYPRWEDTRSGSGFNFRMSELQGAVGIAQLKKLDIIVEAQRNASLRLQNALSKIPSIEFREVPAGGVETADALIFLVPTSEQAKKCREKLITRGFSTKILPEAYTWHFAGCWDHMPSLSQEPNVDLFNKLTQSRFYLDRAVSLPINSSVDELAIDQIMQSIEEALGD